MVNFIAATACGYLAGLGVGGGSLLMLWLGTVAGLSHPESRVINLLFFIPSAVIASLFRWKQGTLQLKKLFPAIAAGCIGAILFSLLSRYFDSRILEKIFGCLLLLTGIREFLYKPS